MIVVDTNVLILGLAGKKPEADVLRKFILPKNIIFSPIVVAEFLARADKKDQKLLKKLLSQFSVIPIENITAEIAANYRQKFTRKKKKVYLLDCFITASCKQHNCALVTNNIKDFPMNDIKIYTPQKLLKKIKQSVKL